MSSGGTNATGVVSMTPEQGREIMRRVRLAMSKATLEDVHPELIRRMEGQPRHETNFNPERLKRLANSIKETGQIMPGIIRRITKDGGGRSYELCDGERRWRAVKLANIATYRALVVDIDETAAQYVISIVTNNNHEGHTMPELLESIWKQRDELSLGFAEIASNVGYTDVHVRELYGLKNLIPEVRDMLDPNLYKKTLTAQAAIGICRAPAKHQLALAQRVLNGELQGRLVSDELRSNPQIYGRVVREKSVAPSGRRKSIDSRIATLHAAARDLELIMKKPEAPAAMSEWGLPTLQILQKKLVESAQSLIASNEVLTAEIERKKPKVIRAGR